MVKRKISFPCWGLNDNPKDESPSFYRLLEKLSDLLTFTWFWYIVIKEFFVPDLNN
jgi:hypothetical protein